LTYLEAEVSYACQACYATESEMQNASYHSAVVRIGKRVV